MRHALREIALAGALVFAFCASLGLGIGVIGCIAWLMQTYLPMPR